MKKITCIICPRGCEITVNPEARETAGNGCSRGRDYALAECLCPMRTVTASMEVANRPGQLVSVKTSCPVPKEKMLEVMAAVHGKKAVAPVKIRDIIIGNVCGADIIATRNVD